MLDLLRENFTNSLEPWQNMQVTLVSAVTGELISRVLSGLIRRYGKDATTREKLQRLEMLLIKTHSAVEASEKRTINNSWLLLWRDKLKEAASQGDDVLAIFLQRAKDAQTTSNVHANQQQGEATSSSAAAPGTAVGAPSFTRNSLSGIVQGIRSDIKMLFVSSDDGMERLNKILARLEKLSPDIGEFIRLLHIEVLPRIVNPMRCRRAVCGNRSLSPISKKENLSLSTIMHGPTKKMRKRTRHSFSSGCGLFGLLPLEEKTKKMSAHCTEAEKSEMFFGSKFDSPCLQQEQQGALLQGRLEAAFSKICKAVEQADCHNLEALEWLAYWGDILREAKEQDCAILGTISARRTAEDKEGLLARGDQQRYELSSFVHRQEELARDVEHFTKLVHLCPAC